MTQSPKLTGLYKPGTSVKESFGICIFGHGGSGKTTLAGTMPGHGLLVDVPQIEGGTFVLQQHADRIDIKPVEEWDEIDEVYRVLSVQDPSDPDRYRWVAIDSVTAFTELAKRKTVKERGLTMDPSQIGLQEWGKIGNLVGELVYRFRKLDIHTIWLAQEHKFGQDHEILGPNTSPAAREKLLPSMMMVGHLFVADVEGKPERRLRVGPHADFDTKCRTLPGVDMPAIIRNPNLGQILPYMLGRGARPDEAADGPAGFFIPA